MTVPVIVARAAGLASLAGGGVRTELAKTKSGQILMLQWLGRPGWKRDRPPPDRGGKR